MKYYDITVPIQSGMAVFEGDPDVIISPFMSLKSGSAYNMMAISMGSHTGTHIDAPAHFFQSGMTVDRIPPEILIGPVLVIQVRNEKVITRKILESHDLTGETRLLIKTDVSIMRERQNRFRTDYAHLDLESAGFLVDQGIKLVGIDAFSIEEYNSVNNICHKILLGGNVFILEQLNLRDIKPGRYELICLPLNIKNGDGAPARALLKEIGTVE